MCFLYSSSFFKSSNICIELDQICSSLSLSLQKKFRERTIIIDSTRFNYFFSPFAIFISFPWRHVQKLEIEEGVGKITDEKGERKRVVLAVIFPLAFMSEGGKMGLEK